MKLFVLFFSFLLSLESSAHFLRIVSDSNLHLVDEKGQIFLKGKFSLENQGDETAYEVFPEFTIDNWNMALSSQTLQANQKFIWEVNRLIPQNLLCLRSSAQCPLGLPAQGDFRVRVVKNYQDGNGYLFSALDILSLAFKKDSSSHSEQLPFRLELRVMAESELVYRADYTIFNQVDHSVKLGLHYLAPKEVELAMPALPVEVLPNGELRGSFVFKNKTGLIGSEYLIFLVAETAIKNERKFVWSSALFKIQKFMDPNQGFPSPSKEGIFIFFWIFLSVLAFGWVYFYWQKNIGKFEK